jgi:hypothetical protein
MSGKRGFLLLFLAFLLFTSAEGVYSIYEESVYSGTVKHGEIVEISSQDFQFRIDSESSKVVVEIGLSGIIIGNKQCRIKGNFDVCIKNISFSHRNLTTYADIFQTEVEVFKIKSRLGITHIIDKNRILIGDEAIAEISVENTADIVAEDFSAKIAFPSSVQATTKGGCTISSGGISFKENIHPKQIKKCTYKIKGVSGDEFDLAVNATYFDGIEIVEADIDPINFKVYNRSLKISSDMNKSRLGFDEELNFTINLENINDEYELKITNFILRIPDNILVVKKPQEMISTNKLLSWSGALEPGEKKSFVARLQARRTGNNSILASATYKISKFLRDIQHKSNLEAYCDCPYIFYELSPQQYSPGQKIFLKSYLLNQDNLSSFGNLKVSYATNIPTLQDFSKSYSDISPRGSVMIFDSSFNAPGLGELYYFNITSSYESKNHEIFVEQEDIIIRIPDQEKISDDVQERVKEEQVLEDSTIEKDEVTQESQQEENEEVPVTTLQKESSFKNYFFIGIIAAIIFLVVVMVILKRKYGNREAKPVNEINAITAGKKPSMKEWLHLDLLKKGNLENSKNYEKDQNYKDLEKQINRLNVSSEAETKKKSFGFLRKK